MGLVQLLTIINAAYRPISGERSFLLLNIARMLVNPHVIVNVGIPGNIIRISDMLRSEYWGSPDTRQCDRAIVGSLGRDTALSLVDVRRLPDAFSPAQLGEAVHESLFAELDRMAIAMGKGETIEL